MGREAQQLIPKAYFSECSPLHPTDMVKLRQARISLGCFETAKYWAVFNTAAPHHLHFLFTSHTVPALKSHGFTGAHHPSFCTKAAAISLSWGAALNDFFGCFIFLLVIIIHQLSMVLITVVFECLFLQAWVACCTPSCLTADRRATSQAPSGNEPSTSCTLSVLFWSLHMSFIFLIWY